MVESSVVWCVVMSMIESGMVWCVVMWCGVVEYDGCGVLW